MVCFVLPMLLSGQKKLDFGIYLGMSSHGSDVNSFGKHGASLFNESNLGYGAHLRYGLSDQFGLKLHYKGTKLTADDANLADKEEWGPEHVMRGFTYETSLSEVGLMLDWEILGKNRYSEEDDNGFMRKIFKKVITPYLSAGVALAFVSDDAAARSYNEGSQFVQQNLINGVNADKANGSEGGFQVPFGGGIRFDLSRNVYFDLEYTARLPLSDYLDGVSESGNPDKNDAYQFCGLNLGLRFGPEPDADKDGIPDRTDECPLVPGIEEFNGCPDTDGDGITDAEDDCPQVAGLAQYRGCPDTDSDGIIDKDDACPTVAGEARYNGCPDTDGDGLGDDTDECPNEMGMAKYGGCPTPDTDGDGFDDEADECINTVGTVNGCPDKDGDGFADKDDKCPDDAGTVNGCPDSDNDGVADIDDKCPNQAGVASNNGCPEYTPPTREQLINGYCAPPLTFGSSSSGNRAALKAVIDDVKNFAETYPEAFIHVSGYTDSVGSEAANLSLSTKRARRVATALKNAGIDPARITYEGYGESNPVADNETAEGRELNRRVSVCGSTVKREAAGFGVKGSRF